MKRRIICVLIISALFLSLFPCVNVAAEIAASYGMPTIFPPSEHPRVMFRSADVSRIITNSAKSQNVKANAYFEGLINESFSGTVSGSNSYSRTIENLIEANAFYYALYGDTEKGNKAVGELINYLTTVSFSKAVSDYTRDMGCAVFKTAEVYDWCYDLLTSEQKQFIISRAESIMSEMEMGYPDVSYHGNIVGHNSEAQLFRDMLAFGIAVYDERPDIYDYVMGRIQAEMVPARNYYYQSNSIHQGSSYGFYRFYWDLWAEKLVMAMSGESLFDYDAMKEIGYYQIYSRRPDGRMFIEGDDASLTWGGYNGHSFFTAFFAGSIFNNAYFKGEYRRCKGSEDFSQDNFTNYRSFTSVCWLIMNNPDIEFKTDRNSLPESRYFGSPNGTILAKTGWNYTTSDATGNNTVSAMMKIGERYASNHDHLDAGTFQLYYKGILASDSGVYDNYSSTHNANYAKRTVAHNALTIYDENESFNVLNKGTANDGGQKWEGEPHTFSQWMGDNYKHGTVMDHEIAPDNSYSYIKGDITSAYSSDKAEKVERSMSFLETDDETFPAIMVIYDRVKSKTPSQTKKFLIHTQTEPVISGTTTTVVNQNTVAVGASNTKRYNGRMVMNTLLPENAVITKIGGSGNEYSVNGVNYASSKNDMQYEGGWGRVEVTPQSEVTSTEFLNILAVSDGDCTESVSSELIRGTNIVGARTLNNVVLFSNEEDAKGGRIKSSAAFTVPGSDSGLKFNVFGVKAGKWIVKRNGSVIKSCEATDDGATIAFTGDAGSYELAFLGVCADETVFSDANISRSGYSGNFQASYGNSASFYNRYYEGSDDGANRTIKIVMNDSWQRQRAIIESGIVGEEFIRGVHFAHARLKIAVKKVGSEKVVLRLMPIDSEWHKDSKYYVQNTAFDIVYEADETGNSGYISTYGGTSSGVSGNDLCNLYQSTDPNDKTALMYSGRKLLKFGTGSRLFYQTFDFIFDCKKGYVYCYVDGRLMATKTDAVCNFGSFYGYSLTGSCDEACYANGTTIWFQYDTARPGETLYVDTDDYTVRLEDVLVDAGLASNNGDPCQIMESDHIADYIFAGEPDSAKTSTYERRDGNGEPVSMTAEKTYNDGGEVAGLYGGFYTKKKDWPGYVRGKGIIHLSFDQKINAKMNDNTDASSTSYSFKLVKQGGTQLELLKLVPTGSGKMRIKLIDKMLNPSTYLDKSFNDTVHFDIILKGKNYNTDPETTYAVAEGYYFADGQYIGAYTLNSGTDEWWTPTAFSLYSDGTANVTYSDYKIAVYKYDKDIEEFIADIEGYKVYWKPIGNGIIKDGGSFTVNAVPETVYGKTPENMPKTIIAAYGADNRLIKILYAADYVSGTVAADTESDSEIERVRAFVWETENVCPISRVLELNID